MAEQLCKRHRELKEALEKGDRSAAIDARVLLKREGPVPDCKQCNTGAG